KKQYAALPNSEMMKPFSFHESKKSRHEGGKPELCTVEGEALKNPQIYNSNFLIEIYFKTAPGNKGAVLMEKMKGSSGYSLTVNQVGGLSFCVKGPGAFALAESKGKVNDGKWRHVIAEAD